MKAKTAKIISVIGHPLLLGSVYVIAVSFQRLTLEQAYFVSLSIICIVTLPISIHNWHKTKKGTYTNFDVSDQKQRKGFYPVVMLLILILMSTFYFMNLPLTVLLNTLVFSGLILIMALVNFKIKASMHAAIAFYVSMGLWDLSVFIGIPAIVLALATSWSRLEMKRHSLNEIATGSLLGLLFGLIGIVLL
ncbi:hypothetical protein [Fontibacter flavus]|uniref:PAP2 superfamily protein n=1 Tax=Fontibacter flavus TaxID=654838 RepID=A0ABV6FN60_9BACT